MKQLAAALVCGVIGTSPAAACPDTPHRFETFSLPAPALGHAKRILVYLPPGYDCTAARYPVFYFNDGHDLFEWNPFAVDLDPALAGEIAAREGWYGSWRLDEQLDRGIAERDLPPMVVVGIAADDGLRSRDLAPVPWDGSAEARGVSYGQFVADMVIRTVDRAYRTIDARRCRGIGGASLGGVSALQIGLTHHQQFGMVLAFSPVLRDPPIAGFLAALWRSRGARGPSVLIDFDDDPVGHADFAWFEAMAAARPQTTLVQTPRGKHTIASWAERAVPALERLFGRQCLD
jgi:enterochelin esterase-like enzyme